MENCVKVSKNQPFEIFSNSLNNCCRFCLKPTKTGINVTDKCFIKNSDTLEDDSIYDFVKKLGFIKMENTIECPTKVCNCCYDFLKLCYNFIQTCKKTDSFLRNIHERKKEEIVDVKPTELKQTDQSSVENNTKYESIYNCSLCTLKFRTNKALNFHYIATHSGKKYKTFVKFQCKNCSLSFKDVQKLKTHYKSVHNLTDITDEFFNKKIRQFVEVDNKKSFCFHCVPHKEFATQEELSEHLNAQHKTQKCPDCDEVFRNDCNLIKHGLKAHGKYFANHHTVFTKILKTEEETEKVKNYECDICHKKYTYKNSMKRHILKTHLGLSGAYACVCSYCGKTLSNKLNLKSHIEFVHETLLVSCPICKKKINFKTIGKHYKTHRSEPKTASYLCTHCGKILKSQKSFEDHQKLHKNIRDELCDICGSGFTTKKYLRLHKKTHEGTRRKIYGCNQCEKVFRGRQTLNRHLLCHSGEKNFICEMCSKNFYTVQELNRHVRGHRKEYKFDCQLCDMRFLEKSRFRHHMMRHRNVRPYKCELCEKVFIVKGKLNLHMMNKHNVSVVSGRGVWKDPKTYVPLDKLL